MKSALKEQPASVMPLPVDRSSPGPVLVPSGRDSIVIKGGTTIHLGDDIFVIAEDTPVALASPEPGTDYFVRFVEGVPTATAVKRPPIGADESALLGAEVFGGFHYAPGGNALARAGGDEVPAINPYSCWDLGFRPACPDPTGMTLVDGRFWCDIYLLGMHPFRDGSSRCGLEIADGDEDLPFNEADDTPFDALDYPTSTRIFELLDKQLLGAEEFFLAALGVTEGTSIGRDPKITKLDAPRTSKWGVMQATGNMSTWGHNGDPDEAFRKCARFGGNWGAGVFAGSRYADVGHWPGDSDEWVGARGRSDHLALDA